MNLTKDQQALLDGGEGEIKAKCMKWLVDWGTAMGARRLVPIENAMPAYINAPGHTMQGAPQRDIDEYVAFIEQFLQQEVKCPTSHHIARWDIEDPGMLEIDSENISIQNRFLEKGRDCGMALTWTCTPYLAGVIPLKGQICAWTESHSVVFINSFLGARSTRNSGETAMAAAITGWIPEFGVLLDENRTADVLIEVQTALDDDLDWGLLGYFAGDIANIRTPAIRGAKPCRMEAALQLCSGVASSGGSTMLHLIGVTPEAPNEQTVFPGGVPTKVHSFGDAEKEEVLKRYSVPAGAEVDAVYFGCPHSTNQDIIEIAKLLRGKKIKPGVTLYVGMTYAGKMYARRFGYAQIIEEAGGVLMADTCPLQSPYYPKIRDIKCLATTSVKQAHYGRQMLSNCKTVLGNKKSCVSAALTGRWEG